MITIDQEEFEKAKKELEGIMEKAIPALNVVTAKVINDSTKAARKEAVDQITDNYYIDKDPIRQAFEITKANPSSLEAQVRNTRRRNKDRFTLARFKVEVPSSGPIKVAQSKSGGLQEIKRAFLGEKRGQYGNQQVFRRSGPNRYPLTVERSYSVGGMIGASNLGKYIEETAEEYIEENFPKAVDEYFEKVST